MKFEPGTRVGPYQILGELGRGGMATVYRAYQPSLEREVAIKVLPEFLIEEPGFKTRFHREAIAVARLQHPNILSVFDHGEQDGVTYIVSEFVEGGTLAARLGAPIQLDYCVRMLRPIADALDYAHGEGVVHRDVKPSNILLDRRGVPILSDFGLARMAETRDSERLTQSGSTVGTPTYMAPEQCAGREAGPPADIYALAVIAYEMITGRVPFTAPTPLGVMSAHQLKAPPSPRKVNPSLPAVIEEPLLAGLAKDPADRPETATDFVEGLAAAVSSSALQMPLTAPPNYPLSPPPPSGARGAQSAPPPSITPAPEQAFPPTPSIAPPPQPSPPPPSVSWPAVPGASPPVASPPPTPPRASPPPPTVSPPPPTPVPAPYAPPPTPYPPHVSYPPAVPQQPQYAAQPTPYPAPGGYQSPGAYAQPQPQWGGAQAAGREGLPMWVLVLLGISAGLAAVGMFVAIGWNLFAPNMSGSDRWGWLVVALLFGLATSVPIAALIGLTGRDRWARVAGWLAVAALALTVVGIPLAAFVAWGLAKAPASVQGASGPKPGGTLRGWSASGAVVVALLLVGSSSAFGWANGSTSPTPSTNRTADPNKCPLAQPNAAVGAKTAGFDCGFAIQSTLLQMDCTTATQLPYNLAFLSVDDNKSAIGGGATYNIDSGGCHFSVPANYISGRFELTAQPLDVVAVIDALPLTSTDASVGVLMRCGDSSSPCLDMSMEQPNTVAAFEGTSSLKSVTAAVNSGQVNRFVVFVQGQKVKIWLNGHQVINLTMTTAPHGGTFEVDVTNFDKSSPAKVDLQRVDIFTPA